MQTGYDQTAETAGTYRIAIAANALKVRDLIPSAVDAGGGEFEIPVKNVEQLNEILSKLIGAGILVASVVPSRSVLEQQFREAVGESE